MLVVVATLVVSSAAGAASWWTAPSTRAQASGKHSWVLYSGREGGVRIGFELNGWRLAPAFLTMPVACTGGQRPHRLYIVEYNLRHYPIRVDRQGRFHHRENRLDSFSSNLEEISGRVTPRTIEGTIAISFSDPARVGNEECHSGAHPHGQMEELSFRADRHRG